MYCECSASFPEETRTSSGNGDICRERTRSHNSFSIWWLSLMTSRSSDRRRHELLRWQLLVPPWLLGLGFLET